MDDKIFHGTMPYGHTNWNSKLTEEMVREIRTGVGRPCELGPRYGVSEATIRDVRKRKSWKHI